MASISEIRSSDGSGPAARATLTASRAVDNPTITVDTLSGWPNRFIGVTGTLDNVTNLITTGTLQVFYGQVDSESTISIDSFAPGYTDLGNSVGDVVIIKPTTAWADTIADVLSNALTDDGMVAQVDRSEPGLRFVVSATEPSPDPDSIILWFEPLES